MENYFKILNRIRFLQAKKLEIKTYALQARKHLVDIRLQNEEEQTSMSTTKVHFADQLQSMVSGHYNIIEQEFKRVKSKRVDIVKQMEQMTSFDECYELFTKYVDTTKGMGYFVVKYWEAHRYEDEINKLIPVQVNNTSIQQFLNRAPTKELNVKHPVSSRESISTLSEYYNRDEAHQKVTELEFEVKEELIKLYSIIGDIKTKQAQIEYKWKDLQFELNSKHSELVNEYYKYYNEALSRLRERAGELERAIPMDIQSFAACYTWHQYQRGLRAENNSILKVNYTEWKKESKNHWKEHLRTIGKKDQSKKKKSNKNWVKINKLRMNTWGYKLKRLGRAIRRELFERD